MGAYKRSYATWWLVILQLAFITLKLNGYMEWSWWEVLLPTIMWASIVGGAIFVVLSVYAHAHAACDIACAQHVHGMCTRGG